MGCTDISGVMVRGEQQDAQEFFLKFEEGLLQKLPSK